MQGCTSTMRDGVTLQEKEEENIKGYRKAELKKPKEKSCLLTPESKPFRLQVKGKHSSGKEF